MKKDDLRTLIVILVICILIVGLVLFLNRKSNSDKLTIVTSRNMYFMTLDYTNYYISSVSETNDEIIYDILDDKYKEKKELTMDNIFDKIESYPENSSIKVRKMNYIEIDKSYVIYIEGVIYKDTFDGPEKIDDNFKMILTLDNKTKTFSIYPVFDDNYKKIINKIRKIDITKNENNGLRQNQIINEEQICVMYLNDYINRINNDIDDAYNVLTNKMKEKYPTIDSYQNFVNSNLNKIATAADKCRVTEGKDNTRTYYVVDGNENEYTFYENGIMNYTVEYYLK